MRIPISIRSKILILLASVSVLFAATTYAVQRWVLVPGFTEVERSEARDDLARCVEALDRDAEHLSASAHDWAAWDDMYSYMVDRNEAFAKANMIPQTFNNNHINLLAILLPSGERVWGDLRDDKTTEPIEVPGFWESLCKPDHPLIHHPSPESVVSGVLMTSKGPMLVGSRPIITSKNEGPIRGTLIMGKLLNTEGLAELANRTRVALHVWSIPDQAVPATDQEAMIHLADASKGSHWLHDHDRATLNGYSIIRDVFGKPALLLRADIPRSISLRGMAAANVATFISLAGGFTLLLLAWLIIEFKIIRPLTELTSHAVRIGRDGDLRARLHMRRDDEIGLLAAKFDDMVQNLADARAKMLETARRAGMADVAVEMLHNVGNALNSVNVSVGLVNEKLRNSEMPSLEKATGLIAEHRSNLADYISTDDRGCKLPEFLIEVSKCIAAEHAGVFEEMQRLSSSVEHIRHIVQSQKSRSDHQQMLEDIDPLAVIDEAIRLNAESFNNHGIRISRQFDFSESMELDRHKLLQILTNLISNAKHAVKKHGRSDPHIVLRAGCVRRGEGDFLSVQIIDNGIGIPPENLTRIFAMGFSTREDGQGFGLHSAANMAREMGGSLTAASDGPGRGATFTLELPMVKAKVQA